MVVQASPKGPEIAHSAQKAENVTKGKKSALGAFGKILDGLLSKKGTALFTAIPVGVEAEAGALAGADPAAMGKIGGKVVSKAAKAGVKAKTPEFEPGQVAGTEKKPRKQAPSIDKTIQSEGLVVQAKAEGAEKLSRQKNLEKKAPALTETQAGARAAMPEPKIAESKTGAELSVPAAPERAEKTAPKPENSPRGDIFRKPVEKNAALEQQNKLPMAALGPRQNRVSEEKTTGLKPKEKRKLSVEVRDLREAAAVHAEQLIEAQHNSEVQHNTADPKTVELVVELPNKGRGREPLAGESRNVQGEVLAQELNENLNGDIVRQAQVILRNGVEGTIKLSLKPETLGNVKIQLEMVENKITGHIIVESDEALKAFKQEIHSLEQAFVDSGFTDASLDTALASDGGQNKGQGDEKGAFFSERFAASTYETVEPSGGFFSAIEDTGGYMPINMLV
jgi:flagellar hook-length control protein FliK